MTTTLHPGVDPGFSGHFGSNKIGQVPRKKRDTIPGVMDTVFLNQTRFYPKTVPIVYKGNLIFRQPATKQQLAIKHLIIGQIGEGTKECYGV